MPGKRTKAKPRRAHITEEAAAAFLAGETLALRRALGLRPWEFTISPTEDVAEQEQWSVEKLMAHREQIETELRKGEWKTPTWDTSNLTWDDEGGEPMQDESGNPIELEG